MAKASREIAAQRREQIVLAASRTLRAGGGVSVPEAMAAAGLTHGGFYKHFASKDALEAEAHGRALEETAELIWSLIERHEGDGDAARTAWVDHYLSTAHRDDMAGGCATAALAGARRAPLREPVAAGVERMVEILTALSGTRQAALADLSLLVGALILARASAGRTLSDELLTAARARLA